MKPIIYLGLPMGSRQLDIGSSIAFATPSRRPDLFDVIQRRAQGGMTFTQLWAEALNRRSEGVTHYAQVHTDVDPELWWLDTYWDIMAARRCKILAGVIAMKDDLQETSTGYAKAFGDRIVKKLSLEETDLLPRTFSIKDVMPNSWQNYHLALNNGLFLADISGEWAEQVEWTCHGGIHNVLKRFHNWFESEDWLESRKIADLLQPEEILATSEVVIRHWGWFAIANRAMKNMKCKTCRDLGMIDNGSDTVPCPDCATPQDEISLQV